LKRQPVHISFTILPPPNSLQFRFCRNRLCSPPRGPHTDATFLTVLAQNDVPGLQLRKHKVNAWEQPRSRTHLSSNRRCAASLVQWALYIDSSPGIERDLICQVCDPVLCARTTSWGVFHTSCCVGYQGSGPSFENTPPVGPSSSSSARRVAAMAPTSTGWIPLLSFKSVLVNPGFAEFTLMFVSRSSYAR
jgi:hypothetical protein